MTQPTLINVHPNENTQRLQYYPSAVNSYRCIGSCNTLNDLSNRACVPNITKDLNLSVFSTVTEKQWIKKINKTYIMQMWI